MLPIRATYSHIDYTELNSKQQEVYNFQKVSAVLAEYGFNCIKLSDDWQGADFLAYHFNGNDFIKVQLKGRLTFQRQYIGKRIYIAFCFNGDWYMCPHDAFLKEINERLNFTERNSWKDGGKVSWGNPSKEILTLANKYKITGD